MSFTIADFFPASALVAAGGFARFGVPESGTPGTLVYCEHRGFLEQALAGAHVSAILTTQQALATTGPVAGKAIVVCEQPRLEYWRLFGMLAEQGLLKPALEYGRGAGCRIHPSAVVSEKAFLADGVCVEAQAWVGDYSVVGPGSLIGPGARIGNDGLQSVADGERRLFVRHAGGVRLGSRVAVLANAVVARAVYPEFTTVGDDTHLSLLSSIGHQSVIGRRCSIAGNCLIGGSVRMGDDVTVGPSATIKDALRIGDGARIRMGSVVVEDVAAGADVSGNFAVPHLSNVRAHARRRRDAG